jgi:hypothetical protein
MRLDRIEEYIGNQRLQLDFFEGAISVMRDRLNEIEERFDREDTLQLEASEQG